MLKVSTLFAAGLDNSRVYNTALDDATVIGLTTIPEPASLALVGLGSLLIAGGRRRQA